MEEFTQGVMATADLNCNGELSFTEIITNLGASKYEETSHSHCIPPRQWPNRTS